jgi:hypothetical protein
LALAERAWRWLFFHIAVLMLPGGAYFWLVHLAEEVRGFSIYGPSLYWMQMRLRLIRLKLSIPDEGIRRQAAQKNYEKGFFRFVLTRAVTFGSMLFIFNLYLMLRGGSISAPNMETAGLICIGGGILLAIGLWLNLLRVLRRRLYY